MAYTIINIGVEPNDGTGSSIRNALKTVNDNFELVNDALYAGTRQSIISALSVSSNYFISNTYLIANTFVNADSLIGNTVNCQSNLTVGSGGIYVSGGGAYITGNVNIIGNLNVTGAQQSSQSSNSTAPILLIHANAAPYTSDDGKDIGLEWQYYDGTDKYGFLGWQNTTGSLVYLDNVTDTANVITNGSFGNVQFGQLLLSNTTPSVSNVTGALQVLGGVGIAGNLHATSANIGNLRVTGNVLGAMYFAGGADTIFVNGSPVQTAAQSFNGGTVGLPTIFADTTNSVGLGTGAVRVAGGFTANGNVFFNNLQITTGGNVRSNLIGNIFTNAQPHITSLGTLTTLNVDGQSTFGNVLPSATNTYTLGTAGSKWLQGHFFNLFTSQITASQLSGPVTHSGIPTFSSNILAISGTDSTNINTGALVLTGFGGLGVGGTIHVGGNIYIDNVANESGLIASTQSAYVFNETASTVHIAAAGQTIFANARQATSTTTGAVIISNGGMSITQGNLYIGQSQGNSIIASGNVAAQGNIVSLGNIFTGSGLSNGLFGNILGSPLTGNAHITTNLIPTANVGYSLGGRFSRFQTVFANVVSSLSIEAGNLTLANIQSSGGVFTGVVEGLTAPQFTSNTMLATTEFVSSADNLKANIASPTFTGNVSLPSNTVGVTQAGGDSSTKLATTAFSANASNLTSGEVPYDRLPAGSVIQVLTSVSGPARQTITSSAGSAPQAVTGLSVSITPRYSDSRILIQAFVAGSATHVHSLAIYKDGAATVSTSGQTNNNYPNMQVTQYGTGGSAGADFMAVIPVTHTEIAGSTTARTYQVYAISRWSNTGYSTYINNRASNDMASFSHIIVYEIAQ